MKIIRQIPTIASILIVLCYLTFTALAIINYPLPYSPMTHWLSDLGNVNVSPSGAWFYNLGIILTGMLLLTFYLTIFVWRLEHNKIQNLMVTLTQVFGVIGAASMIMSALYPINVPVPHSFWSAALDIAIGTSFAFSVAALRYYQETPRWILVMGVITWLVDTLFSIFFNNVHILEWVTVVLFLGYILALGFVTRLLSTKYNHTITG
jgi:hypothetical membrane protein